MIDFSNIESYRENNRIEAKKAIGGLPESIWETYSAFANTLGGIILLGVEELRDKSFRAVDLPSPQWLIEDFWDIVNNPKRVSVNVLSPKNVTVEEIQGKRIVAIRIPRAEPKDMPVYIDGNLFRGTYKRNGEGDHHCTPDEIYMMMRAADTNVPEKDGICQRAVIIYLTEYIFASAQELSRLLCLDMEQTEEIISELLKNDIISESRKDGKPVYRLKE